MARINTYANDQSISGNDKVLGTDTTSTTRNYTFTDIGSYLNKANVVSILGQNNFIFQKELVNNVRQNGSVSFLGYSGAGTQLSAITSLVFSAKNSAGVTVNEFITSLVGKNMMFSQLDNPNNYAQYKLNSFTEISNEPGFYTASLQYISGSGAINENAYYGLALYFLGGGANWGEIEGTVTDQTDLVNYITSRLPDVPFETVSDIVNALNSLDTFRLQSSVDFRPENFGIGDEGDEYTFPAPQTVEEKYGYFLFSDTDGSLNWKQFPLDFITGFDEGAKVDGGTF